MCGDAKPQNCVEVLREAFSARDVLVKTHQRGEELDELRWQAASSKKAPVRLKSVKKDQEGGLSGRRPAGSRRSIAPRFRLALGRRSRKSTVSPSGFADARVLAS